MTHQLIENFPVAIYRILDNQNN